jgi:hypothetical protein
MRHPTDIFWIFLFSTMAVTILVGIPFCVSEWKRQLSSGQLRGWKSVIVTAAICAVTLQGVCCLTLWVPFNISFSFFKWANLRALILMVVGLSCAFSWKGKARWWLVTSSISLTAAFFVTLLALIAE